MRLEPELVLQAYSVGAFPMARSRRGPIEWYRPDPRAILPLDERFRVRRSLRQAVRSGRFEVRRDTAFEEVIRACAQPRPTSRETWISEPIIEAFTRLHHAGFAHSVEAWQSPEGGGEPRLVGGLYGVALGGAFFGESMFSRASMASQVCLVHLVDHLRARGFTVLDVQFRNPHLEQFGVMEVPCAAYLEMLASALELDARW